MNEVCLNQLAITFELPDSISNELSKKEIIEAIQLENTSFVNSAIWKDIPMVRISIISGQTTEADIELLEESILSAFSSVKNI